MCITEYNEEETLQAIGNEKFAEGRAVGKDDINSNSTGWWVEDISGWWPSNAWLKIDGYWIDADGVCR